MRHDAPKCTMVSTVAANHVWQHATIRTRFKEMEYMLKMQRIRIQVFNLNFATVSAA